MSLLRTQEYLIRMLGKQHTFDVALACMRPRVRPHYHINTVVHACDPSILGEIEDSEVQNHS